MIYYYSLFTIFAIIATMMIIDQNVGDYIVLLSKLIKSKIERLYWMIRFHPVLFSSPIGKWLMMRKHMRTAEKLAQELSKKQDEVL
jgi:hypothetical protein